MRKQVIAYLHTHWDREWYREFEVFRMRLLRVFDNIIYMLESNKIPSFYFDGTSGFEFKQSEGKLKLVARKVDNLEKALLMLKKLQQ